MRSFVMNACDICRLAILTVGCTSGTVEPGYAEGVAGQSGLVGMGTSLGGLAGAAGEGHVPLPPGGHGGTRASGTPPDVSEVAGNGGQAGQQTGEHAQGGAMTVAPPARPPGVPMFVAVGFGGRTIVSCDDGLSWKHDRALGSSDSDHDEFTDKGFAYGDGVFLQLLGWGAEASVQVSRNGVDWKRIRLEDSFAATVAFVGDGFVVARPASSHFSSDGGATWTERASPRIDDHVREGGGNGPSPGLMVIGHGNAMKLTVDGGKTWGAVRGCGAVGSFGGVGHLGGMQYANGIFVAFDEDGDWCSSPDRGNTWRSGRVTLRGPRALHGKLFHAAGRFWFMNGPEAVVSKDGVDWKTITWIPDGLALHAMAGSPQGTLVAFDRDKHAFYRSTESKDDVPRWTQSTRTPGRTRLTRLVFGYGEVSSGCRR